MTGASTYDLSGKRVFVAGHRGMVGSAVVRRLASENCTVLVADRRELDVTKEEPSLRRPGRDHSSSATASNRAASFSPAARTSAATRAGSWVS